eukprot:gene2431-3001_t
MLSSLTKQVIGVIPKNGINLGVRCLVNNSNNGSYFYSTSTTTTTVVEEKKSFRTHGVAMPNKMPTPPKVPKRRPGKVKSIYYPEYAHIPRVAPLGLVRSVKLGYDFYLIDIREPEHFQKETIVGAVNHPLSTLEQTCSKLDKETMVMVFGPKERGYPTTCEAALKLLNKGFKNVLVVESGVKELVDKGFFYDSETDSQLQ